MYRLACVVGIAKMYRLSCVVDKSYYNHISCQYELTDKIKRIR